MSVAKAALESWVRELAARLGEGGHRVNAISAGPIRTLAAGGIPGFDRILDHVERNSPLRRNTTQQDVAGAAVWLASPLSGAVTGQILHVDCGYSITMGTRVSTIEVRMWLSMNPLRTRLSRLQSSELEQFYLMHPMLKYSGRNVINTHVSIREVPENRWVVADHWVEGGPKNVPEGKTYSKIGGFVEDYEFDWRRWRVPPGSLAQIDLCQQWAVSVSAAALEDAGYLGDNSRFELPNARTGVIFANALGGRIGIYPIIEYGLIHLQGRRLRPECLPNLLIHSKKRFLKGRLESMRIPCPENWRM